MKADEAESPIGRRLSMGGIDFAGFESPWMSPRRALYY